MNIYVGNMSYDVSEDDLKMAFEAFGHVSSVNIITDRYSGRSKGFGFVEMPEEGEAKSAIEGLNNKDLKGRPLNVSKARPRARDRRGGGGRRGGGRRF